MPLMPVVLLSFSRITPDSSATGEAHSDLNRGSSNTDFRRTATGSGVYNNWSWSEIAVPIGNMKAVKGCGIGVTAWNGELNSLKTVSPY